MNLINEKIIDFSSRKLLERLKDTPDIRQSKYFYSEIIYLLEINFCMFNFSDVTNTVLFYLLRAIFVPTSKKVTSDHNGKINQVKHSIKDSQNSFMVFKNSVCEIEEKTLSNHLF